MISSKLSIFLLIALAYATVIRTEDDIEGQKLPEHKGLFGDLKEKVYNTLDRALENSKATFKTTEDELSNHFNNLKDKGKELFKDEPEKPENLDSTVQLK